MRFTDIDWRVVLEQWDEYELYYLRDIIEEEIARRESKRICEDVW